MSGNPPVLKRMSVILQTWEEITNPNALFLNCYQMMTSNTLAAIEQKDFNDPAWVSHLLHHFADYYFIALDAYEADPSSAPRIWKFTFDAAQETKTSPVQNLLLGVNAHINYDLAFAVADLLEEEWDHLPEGQRKSRFEDYTHINTIIGKTIDGVQDEVLEPAMPAMDIMDKLMGRFDELLISHLINEWRESVWEHVLQLLRAQDDEQRAAVMQEIETEALRLAEVICF